MNVAHALFHHDSRHLLTYLRRDPTDRRERSLLLCTALMRAAGLDLNEQGDVWAQVAQVRADLFSGPPHSGEWTALIGNVQHLLLGTAHTGADDTTSAWHTGFADAGIALQTLRETGKLTRGLRAVITQHVIFHWNRIGLPGATQAILAHAAKDAILGS